jgi:hypothetical protein
MYKRGTGPSSSDNLLTRPRSGSAGLSGALATVKFASMDKIIREGRNLTLEEFLSGPWLHNEDMFVYGLVYTAHRERIRDVG